MTFSGSDMGIDVSVGQEMKHCGLYKLQATCSLDMCLAVHYVEQASYKVMSSE